MHPLSMKLRIKTNKLCRRDSKMVDKLLTQVCQLQELVTGIKSTKLVVFKPVKICQLLKDLVHQINHNTLLFQQISNF